MSDAGTIALPIHSFKQLQQAEQLKKKLAEQRIHQIKDWQADLNAKAKAQAAAQQAQLRATHEAMSLPPIGTQIKAAPTPSHVEIPSHQLWGGGVLIVITLVVVFWRLSRKKH